MVLISKNLDRLVAKENISENDKKNIIIFATIKSGVNAVDLVIEADTENIDLKV